MRATFTPAARLHRPSEYSQVLKGRRIARGALFVLMASKPLDDPAMGSGQPQKGAPAAPRLGMIIARRFAPRAVTRNTIKRILREAFRHRQNDLPAYDYVFRLHSPPGNISLRQLKKQARAEADALLDRAASA